MLLSFKYDTVASTEASSMSRSTEDSRVSTSTEAPSVQKPRV